MARSEMRDERHVPKRYGSSVAERPVDRMLFRAGPHRLQRGNIFGHRHHLSARHLLQQRVAFLMVAVGMGSEKNFGIGELESELLNRLRNRGYIPFVRTVDQNIPLRGYDEERAQRSRADVIDVADDLMRREWARLIFSRAHIAFHDGSWRIRLALN